MQCKVLQKLPKHIVEWESQVGTPGGKKRMYDGNVVEPLGSYTFTVCSNSVPKYKIPFDFLESAPWLIIDGNNCSKVWIPVGSDQYLLSSNSKQYEPLLFNKPMRDFDDDITGLGCLPG